MSTGAGESTQGWDIVARCAEAFIENWEAGSTPPPLEPHLTGLSGSLRKRVLLELIKIDLDYHWQRDLPVRSLEDYLADHPEGLEEGEPPLELIQEDYFLRCRSGPSEVQEELVARYPQHADTLQGLSWVGARTRISTAAGPRGSRAASQDPVGLFGRYDLLEVIGKGGMGKVWKAWDPTIGRIVALKTIGDLGKSGYVERFRREARLAARLRHPNILPIFDIGCHEGTHYLTTVLIEGRDLRSYLPEEATIQERVRLVVGVARALAHAHERGIIHRDVKPNNILVDGEGCPYLIDFGLAREVDVSETGLLTLTGDLLGTPYYMSPEQATGDHSEVGPASDQFSLGVVLYEVLTGERPFQGEGLPILLHAILSGEPRSLRNFDRSIPAQLESICLRALEKEISKRYPSVEALADDLDRYLAGESLASGVLPSTARRARRWIRLHRRSVVVGTLCLAVVILLGTVQVVERVGRDRRLRETLSEGKGWEEQQEIEKARDAYSRALAVDAENEEARSGYERTRIAMEKSQERASAQQQAENHFNHGELSMMMGKLEEARQDFTRVLELDAESLHEMALVNRGILRYRGGDLEGALEDLDRAIERFPDSFDGHLNRGYICWDLLRQYDRAISNFDRAIEIDPKHAMAYIYRGNALKMKGDLDRAIADFTRAIEIDPQGGELNTPDGRGMVGFFYVHRGKALLEKGDLDAALVDFTLAIQINPSNADAFNQRGVIRYGKGDLDAALSDFTLAIRFNPHLADAYNSRGAILHGKGDLDGAVADFSRAIEIDPKHSGAYVNRGNVRAGKGDLDAALADFDKAIQIDPELVKAHVDRGMAFQHKGIMDVALSAYGKAIQIDPTCARAYYLRASVSGDRRDFDAAVFDFTRVIELEPNHAGAYNGRGLIFQEQGNLEAAMADFNKAIQINPQGGMAYMNRGNIHLHRKELDRAIAEYRQVLRLDPQEWRAWSNLGVALEAQGQRSEALSAFRKGLALAPERFQPEIALQIRRLEGKR